ncbi:hypothetical protein GCM10017788_80450 [Amycolatopsis acidiphila]|nr:hypothetical protein GCM10017788_80450 [Amycolatopsis acidiphila]
MQLDFDLDDGAAYVVGIAIRLCGITFPIADVEVRRRTDVPAALCTGCLLPLTQLPRLVLV